VLRAKIHNGPFVLGLDAENIKRLQAGQPILVALAELGGTDDVLIMAGNTLADIQNELETAMGTKFPDPMDINKLRNTQ
jgi:hypothetical protein